MTDGQIEPNETMIRMLHGISGETLDLACACFAVTYGKEAHLSAFQ